MPLPARSRAAVEGLPITKAELRNDPELVQALVAPAVPDWLAPIRSEDLLPRDPVARPGTSSNAVAVALTFPNLFEHALDRVRAGETLEGIIENDARNINTAQFLSWVLRSPERKARFYEAQEVAAELMALSLPSIADGISLNGSVVMEDVARSALRISTRKELMGKWNRKRYGDVKSLEVTNTNIDVAKLKQLSLEDLKRMAMDAINSGEVIDVTPENPLE